MHTRLVEEREISGRSRKACQEIQEICSSGNAITLAGSHRDPVQTLLMRRGSGNDSLIMPIIESSAIQAEKQAAGAGELFLKILSNALREDISRKAAGLPEDNEWEKILEKIPSSSVPARKSDISRIFSAGSSSFQDIVKSTFSTVRSGDKILVKKSSAIDTKITRETGYNFSDLEVDQRFFQKGTWIRKNARVVIIDGIIENVSEIHHFLEDLSRSKSPGVIFCLDCLPDITETLIKNYMMGNLDVVIVKVPVTEFHVNTLVDLGTIFETEPIASAMGETISSGLKRQNNTAQRMIIARGQITIERPESRTRVESHLRELRDRIYKNFNLFPILEPRIRSLASSTTKIDVGINDQKIDPNIVESLDRTFRSLPRVFKSGFIEKNEFEGFSSSKICLLFEKNNVVPAEMAQQAIKIFLSTRSAIQSAAVGIERI
jgi:hypothetical protein